MTFRKAALQIAALALLALMAFNTYFAVDHLKRTQKRASLSLESSTVQADISHVWQDFTGMETGQRGYLLTDDPAYLQPYTEGKSAILADLVNLRSALANRPDSEGSRSQQEMEAKLEALAASKQAEIEHSITLRQQGYRKRAFQLVQTNEGKQYTDQAHALISSLSSIENGRFATLEKERAANSNKALSETIAANIFLLALTAGLFLLIRLHERGLEQDAARTKGLLSRRDSHLEELSKKMSSLGEQSRTEIAVIEENARLLLEKYDGFLPPLGYACAEQIKSAAGQLEQLRNDLLGEPVPDMREQAA